MIHPLSEETQKEITRQIQQYWHGNSEKFTTKVISGKAKITLEHTQDDELEIKITIEDPRSFNTKNWPEKMKNINKDFLALTGAINSILGDLNYEKQVKFKKNPNTMNLEKVYKTTVNMREVGENVKTPNYIG